jgi:hypothetical protein
MNGTHESVWVHVAVGTVFTEDLLPFLLALQQLDDLRGLLWWYDARDNNVAKRDEPAEDL